MKGALLASVLSVSGLLAAPVAHAYTDEEWSFLQHTAEIGITNNLGPQATLTAGWSICGSLAKGYTPDAIASYLFYQSNGHPGGITRTQAEMEVALAAVDLCPGIPT